MFPSKKRNLLVGTDPELFIKSNNGEYKSAVGLIGGSKATPRRLNRDGFFALEDNVAVEFNIPPARNVKEFTDSVSWTIKRLGKELKKKNLILDFAASVSFPEQELNTPQAREFGCMPDFNAWKSSEQRLHRNPRPRAADINLRSCGGHDHFGWDNPTNIEKLMVIRSADLYLGIPSILMDSDNNRRKLYGLSGSFRPTSYGAEYRTLSNFWIQSQKTIEWLYTQSVRAFNFAMNPDNYEILEKEKINITKAINKNDHKLALKLLDTYDLVCV